MDKLLYKLNEYLPVGLMLFLGMALWLMRLLILICIPLGAKDKSHRLHKIYDFFAF